MEDNYSEAVLRRYRNLKMFKGKTDEQIMEYLQSRPEKPAEVEAPTPIVLSIESIEYTKRFKSKIKLLQSEYGVDMNDANDAESLRSLVRFNLQLETIDEQIRKFYESKSSNTKTLKDLGDYQRTLQMSISDLSRQLGISRQARKETQNDDIPKRIEELQHKARTLWERKTIPIKCERDQIELARIWLNFPKLKNQADFQLECWKCHEVIIYGI